MNSFSKKILLAGTRVTGVRIHLGTYLGWLKQIEEADEHIDAVIMICDLQSLDCNNNPENTYRLKKNIKKILPQIPVLVESEISNIAVLSLLIASLMNNGISNRISTFRKILRTDSKIPINIFLYPSLMVANLLSINATHMFDKPEGKFQHVDVINDLLRRVNQDGRIWVNKIDKWRKKTVNIPKLSGGGAMKRETSKDDDMILVSDESNVIESKLRTTLVDKSLKANRYLKCKVVFPILKSAQVFNPSLPLESDCLNCRISCDDCIRRLSGIIYKDVNRKRASNPIEKIENRIIEMASERTNEMINSFLRL